MKRMMTLLAGLLTVALAGPALAGDGAGDGVHDAKQKKWDQQHQNGWNDDDDWRDQTGHNKDWDKDDWRDYKKDRKKDNWSYREERRDDWQGWQQGEFNSRGELFWDRKEDRWSWREERNDDRKDYWRDRHDDDDDNDW